jgi:outer membrane protein assembly factor BamA
MARSRRKRHRNTTKPGVKRSWCGSIGDRTLRGGGGRGGNSYVDGVAGGFPDLPNRGSFLLWLTLCWHTVQVWLRAPTALALSVPTAATEEEAAEIYAEHPNDQTKGPLRQVVLRGPVDRLLLPRDRLEQAVNRILHANQNADASIDYTAIRRSIDSLNAFYGEHGYPLALVRRAPDTPIKDGILVLEAYEPLVARVLVEYVDANQEPCSGRTHASVIARALGYDGLGVEKEMPDHQRHSRKSRSAQKACPRKVPFRWTEQHFQRLQQLGLFESVTADVRVIDAVTPHDSPAAEGQVAQAERCAEIGDVELTLRVRERPFHRFEPGITLSRGKLYGDLTLEDANVAGRGIRFQADIRSKPDRSDDAAHIVLQNPRLGSKAGGYQVRLFESRSTAVGSRRGVEVTLMAPQLWSAPTDEARRSSRTWLRPAAWRSVMERTLQLWNIQTGVLCEQVRMFPSGMNPGQTASSSLPASADGASARRNRDEPTTEASTARERSFTHLVLNSSAIRDTRSDPLHPQAGYRLALHAAYAVPVTTSNPEYSRFGFTGSVYKKIPPIRGLLRRRRRKQTEQPETSHQNQEQDEEQPARACVALLAEARVSSASLPESERYPFGGLATVRGMREGSLGQVGSFARTCAEFRYPLDKRLVFVAFTDWGSEIQPPSHLVRFPKLFRRGAHGHRLGTVVDSASAESTSSGVDAPASAGSIQRSSTASGVISVGLGLRVLGALRMECGWILDRAPGGSGGGFLNWRLSRDGYWHIGLVDVSY